MPPSQLALPLNQLHRNQQLFSDHYLDTTLPQQGQEARRDTLDWLRTEFGVEAPGQKLEDYAALISDDFVAEVRKRRPRSAGPLSPAALRALRDGYAQQAIPAQGPLPRPGSRSQCRQPSRRCSTMRSPTPPPSCAFCAHLPGHPQILVHPQAGRWGCASPTAGLSQQRNRPR